MFVELYEKLNVTDKDNFKRVVNILLSKNFILYRMYNNKTEDFVSNPDYLLLDREFDLFKDYFSYSGWKLYKDQNYEVIWLQNELGYNRARLDKNTTLMLYTLRLIYEEKREKVNLSSNVIFTIGELLRKMIDIGAIEKKLPDIELRSSLSKIINHNIVQKIEGNLDSKDTRLLILPSILFILTNDSISKINENINELENEKEENVEIEEVEGEE